MHEFLIIDAPSVLGLSPTGVEDAPEALKNAGLMESLNASYGGIIVPPPYNAVKDPATQLLNPHSIRKFSIQLADRVTQVIHEKQFPVVVGGDCSILIGCMLAMKRSGKYGLFFIDGHADFYQAEAEPKGEAASIELAIISGRGPEILTNIEGLKPLVHDEHIIAFGIRDSEEQKQYGSQDVHKTLVHVFELHQIRAMGIEKASEQAAAILESYKLDGFWIHLDADVLDNNIMPAVDYQLPGGLQWEELIRVLKLLMSSGKAAGITITIFNPKLDPDGSIASMFVRSIAEGLKG